MTPDLVITSPWPDWKPVSASRGYLALKPEFEGKVINVNGTIVCASMSHTAIIKVPSRSEPFEIGICESSPLAQLLKKFTNFFTVQ